jgi:hypothetical protein
MSDASNDLQFEFTIVVTGSREWSDRKLISTTLCEAYLTRGIFPNRVRLIHGCARGADSLAASVAHKLGMQVVGMPADWDKHGKAAGMIRNRAMLDEKPDLVLAFPLPQSVGTLGCIKEARKRQLTVSVVGREHWEVK